MFAAVDSNPLEAELILERDRVLATARYRDFLAREKGETDSWMLFSTGALCARREAARLQTRLERLRHTA